VDLLFEESRKVKRGRSMTNKYGMSSLPDIVTREILLSFWKVHILHHAAEQPIYGQWIADELRRHGYNISPGTLYPLLRRMEKNGWLKCIQPRNSSRNARKEYRLTKDGANILTLLRTQVEELYREVIEEARKRRQR
jgi:PadR family transcriptional regulator, regulatory protein PadR